MLRVIRRFNLHGDDLVTVSGTSEAQLKAADSEGLNTLAIDVLYRPHVIHK